MEASPPSWLNKDFLTQVLKEEENANQKVEVQEFSANLAVGAGNNYLSQIYRVSVKYNVGKKENNQSFIIKVPLSVGFVAETQGNMLDTEQIFYKEVLPKTNKKANHQFGPKVFKSPQTSSMVLQDLKAEGFIMGDRFKRLDLAHCKVVFTTIAKFHASSVAVYNENKDLVISVGKERMYSVDQHMREKKQEWMRETVRGLGGMITAIGGSKEVADLLMSRADQMPINVEKICEPKLKGLNVLNHGDLWTNNMLFKYDTTEEVVDVRLIDFQFTRFSSPVLDLLYFVWTSAKEDVCQHHLQELFQLYLKTLNETLKQIGCEERMSKDEFNQDLKHSLDFAIVTLCQVLPFIICDEDCIINFSEITTEELESGKVDEKFKKVYAGKNFVSIFPSLIHHLNAWFSSLG